ncbi:MAG: DUF2357 domain-containing protein [Roseiflexus sp.]|nr:DUF2357 domain-containing protein [Roseiflexus sp.]MBO9364485.1 DUF2357 domain-containing protein [Roseiflexus sp.]
MTSFVEIDLSLEVEGDPPTLNEHQAVEFVSLPGNAEALELSIDGVVLSPFLRPGDPRWRWTWNPGAAVGTHTLRLAVCQGTRVERVWRLNVAPRKIDSVRYLALIEDVERVAIGLVRSLAGAVVKVHLAANEGAPRSWLDDADMLFGSLFDRFEQATRHILAHPRSTLQRDEHQTPLGQATDVSVTALYRAIQGDLEVAPPDVATHVQRALRPEGGFLPRTTVQERSSVTFDIAEHRLLKHILETLRGRARRCADWAQREVTRLDTVAPGSSRAARARAVALRCTQCLNRIAALLAAPLFDQVTAFHRAPVATPLMQRDSSYRQVYRMWRALHQSMVVDLGASFDLTIIDLPLLYERWCALRVVQSLLNLSETVYACHLLTAPTDETESWALDLRRDLPLLVAGRHGWTLTVRYQPRYPPAVSARSGDTFVSLDCHTRIPDLAIEATRLGYPPRVIVLDAKYRLDADGCTVPADALAEAYAYAGAIGAAGAPAVVAALILYPGTGAAERYPGGAGAIPLLPGAADALDATLAAELTELDTFR